ncbi:MAG: hypothetical protein V1831_04600 [Candidatus Woesearchaeota archaeon]
MRRHREEKKGSKFLVYFIGFIMVFSVFGVIFWGDGDSAETMRYNGFKFVNKGSFLSVNVDGREAMFTYFPSDVEIIPVDGNLIERLKGVIEIDATSDFNDTFAEDIALAEYQMSITLNNFGLFARNGFTTKNNNFDVITCEDSSNFVPVIYFKSSNETKVYLDGDCMIAEASSGIDVLRIKDRLVYGILRVIK